MPVNFDLVWHLTLKLVDFQDTSRNISMSSVVILAIGFCDIFEKQTGNMRKTAKTYPDNTEA